MDAVGIICEYNPFHNGHLYHINEVKKMYPNSILVLVLNGYFLERGDVSLESKEEKTRLALKYGVDLVVEHPFVFASSSADIFAESAIEILNNLKVKHIVFGSESNDTDKLTRLAKEQLENDKFIKKYLDMGINYPTALNKIISEAINKPNDLLAISYIKAIIKNGYDIEYVSIKRTNDFHDLTSNDKIISASNIRNKIVNNEDIKNFIPEGKINKVDNELLFNIIKYKIITEPNLDKYLTVDEGIDNRLKKVIKEVNSLTELIEKTKSKRYTYNRIKRMLIHILIGLTKEDKWKLKHIEYIRILGLNSNGQGYINSIKKDLSIPVVTKMTSVNSKINDYEFKCAQVYELLTNESVTEFELKNRPLR